jgi:hypothetical protein
MEYHNDNDIQEKSKIELLMKLQNLQQCGIKLSENYTIDSDIDKMKFEYEYQKRLNDKRKFEKSVDDLLIMGLIGLDHILKTIEKKEEIKKP